MLETQILKTYRRTKKEKRETCWKEDTDVGKGIAAYKLRER
jgi:hypothetical protein